MTEHRAASLKPMSPMKSPIGQLPVVSPSQADRKATRTTTVSTDALYDVIRVES